MSRATKKMSWGQDRKFWWEGWGRLPCLNGSKKDLQRVIFFLLPLINSSQCLRSILSLRSLQQNCWRHHVTLFKHEYFKSPKQLLPEDERSKCTFWKMTHFYQGTRKCHQTPFPFHSSSKRSGAPSWLKINWHFKKSGKAIFGEKSPVTRNWMEWAKSLTSPQEEAWKKSTQFLHHELFRP